MARHCVHWCACVPQGQLSTADGADGGGRGFDAAALSHVWAWPLPHMDTSAWLPYEQVGCRLLHCRDVHTAVTELQRETVLSRNTGRLCYALFGNQFALLKRTQELERLFRKRPR